MQTTKVIKWKHTPLIANCSQFSFNCSIHNSSYWFTLQHFRRVNITDKIYILFKLCLMCECFIDLSRIMSHSRDYDEQLHVWRAWRDAVGPPIRSKYIRYVQLANHAARLNGKYIFTLKRNIILDFLQHNILTASQLKWTATVILINCLFQYIKRPDINHSSWFSVHMCLNILHCLYISLISIKTQLNTLIS